MIDSKTVDEQIQKVDVDGNGIISLEEHNKFIKEEVLQDDAEDWA